MTFHFKNVKGSGKDASFPLFRSCSVTQFQKCSKKLFWKESFDDEEFQKSDFNKKKIRKDFLDWRSYLGKVGARGTTHTKVEEILKKLSKSMPSNRLQFWNEIPSSTTSKDYQYKPYF